MRIIDAKWLNFLDLSPLSNKLVNAIIVIYMAKVQLFEIINSKFQRKKTRIPSEIYNRSFI